MNGVQKVALVIVILVSVWIAVWSIFALFGDGLLYSIEQPVPVTDIRADRVTVVIDRQTRFSMSAMCAVELHCAEYHTYELGEWPCPLECGEGPLLFPLHVPLNLEGPCHFIGTVSYHPVPLSPAVTYFWESEPFAPWGE